MLRDDAIEIWKAGVAAVHGRTLVEKALRIEGRSLSFNDQTFEFNDFDRILVVGGGKFSHFMAEGLENILGSNLCNEMSLSGLITVPDGSNEQVSLGFIESAECRPAGLNLPTQRVINATKRMLGLLGEADERTLVVALISGGGSALLENSTLPLKDIIGATNWLSKRGANILELNAVRIALSELKGGGLARAMPAGTMIGLIVSDVPNDDLRYVSSGPTVDFVDNVFQIARNVLNLFSAAEAGSFPRSAVDFLNGDRTRSPIRANVCNILIGDARVALDAAVTKANALGYSLRPDTLADTINCEQIADSVVEFCNGTLKSKQCIINLGEPIVTPGDGAGQGGRNQHAVLLSIERLLTESTEGQFCFLSGGTDGEDGNTSVAGALITNDDMIRIANMKTEIVDAIERFDSHPFLASNGLVFESGTTGTNVADLRVLLREFGN